MTRFCPKWISRLHLWWLWAAWTYRNETPEQYAARIAQTKDIFREIYQRQLREWGDLPDSREFMDRRRTIEKVLDEDVTP